MVAPCCHKVNLGDYLSCVHESLPMAFLKRSLPNHQQIRRIVFSILVLGFAFSVHAGEMLRYDRPATDWMTEALPVGNGTMGAMVFGGTDWERIQFNEKSLWNGDEGKAGAYQAFGDLFIKFDDIGGTNGVVSEYERTLDLEHGIQTTTYLKDGVRFTREVMASHPAGVILVRIATDKPGTLSGRLWLGDMHGGDVIAGTNDITCDGILNNGLAYESRVRVVAEGGRLSRVLENGYDNKPVPRHPPGASVLDGKTDAYLSSGNAVEDPFPYTRMDDTDIAGNPLILGGKWFDRGISIPSKENLRFDLGGKYRWLSFTTDIVGQGVITVTGDGKTIGVAKSPGGYFCFPINGAKEITLSCSNNPIMQLGHLRVSPSERRPTEDPGIVRPSSSDQPPDPSIHAPAEISWFARNVAPSPLPAASLRFEKCNALTLVLGAGTSYLPDRSKEWRGPHPHDGVVRRVDAAAGKPYADLRDEHVRDFTSLFDRMHLEFGVSPVEASILTTDKRLDRYAQGNPDPELEALLFQYGRYLLISASRPGALPANLQGVWNRSNNPPWTCDHHADINIEMNYWPSDVAGLSECFQPLADWMLASLPVWTEATREHFHVPGWTLRGHNGIQGGFGSQWYQACNAWLCRNLWDHYLFTQDKDFLRRVYPLMKGASLFWKDQLVTGPDGTLLTAVSYSPEHGPHETGVSFAQQHVWDLFGNTAEAARLLGVDSPLAQELTEKRAKLLGPQIGRWGQLQEWKEDIDDPQDHHRHTSHMVAVYPGTQISPLKTPALAQAAAVSLKARGDNSTGWALAWRINLWARLKDAGRAYHYIRALIRPADSPIVSGESGGGLYPNLLDCCPPFQIDGNFGYTAGVCEMLLQSQNGIVELLPALPKEWPSGSVRGLHARGGFTVDMKWKDGRVTDYRIMSEKPHQLQVLVNGEEKTITSQQAANP